MSTLELVIDCTGDQGFRLQLDCALPDRGITAIYGPSGSGKSTLLDCVAGLRQPTAASRISFRGDEWLGPSCRVPPWKRNIGYVFQEARLFPHLDVRGNLAYAHKRARAGGHSLDAVVEALDLGDLLTRDVQDISEGKKQRDEIGRALLSSPRLMLLDEPLANLDQAWSLQLLARLRQLAETLHLPMLYVSHDIEEVSQLADHLLLLENGREAARGPLLELSSRLDTRLSHEQQAAAIALARVRRHDTAYGLSELDLEGEPLFVNHLPREPGSACRVRIPARDVSICRERPAQSSILNILPVTVAEIEQTADARMLLRLALGSQFLLARITRKSAATLQLQVGDRVFAQIKSAALLMEASE